MLHFDHVKVQEFFWDLLHPMQGQMILCEKDLYLIWAYFKDTNFMLECSSFMLDHDYDILEDKFEMYNLEPLL